MRANKRKKSGKVSTFEGLILLFFYCIIHIENQIKHINTENILKGAGQTVNKEYLQKWAAMLEKYSLALSMLHPSQMEELQESYIYFLKFGKLPRISDSFLKLAFMMIVSDQLWKERGHE